MVGEPGLGDRPFPGARRLGGQSRYNGDLNGFIHFDILVTLYDNWQSLKPAEAA